MFQRVKSGWAHAARYLGGSINRKLLAVFLLCVILPFGLLGSLLIYQYNQTLVSRELQYAQDKLTIVTRELERLFSDMNTITTSLMANAQFQQTLREAERAPGYGWFQQLKTMESLLQSTAVGAGDAVSLTVITTGGRRFSYNAVFNNNLTPESALIRRIMEAGGNSLWINRPLDGVDKNPVLTLGKMIRYTKNATAAVLADVPLSALDALFQSFDRTENTVILQRTDGHALYAYGLDASQLPANLLHLNMPISQAGASITVYIPRAAALAESSRITRTFTLLFLLIMALCCAVTIAMAGRISRRLRLLTAEVERFGRSGEPIRPLRASHDEVGKLTLGFTSMAARIRALMDAIRESERNNRLLELQALQAKVNPHMIYNTLNTITTLAEIQNVDNIAELSSAFARLLKVISNRKGEFIPIREELEYVRAFLSIKKYNLICDIQTVYDVAPEAMDLRILKLLLQPIVENALVHGFSMDEGVGRLDVAIHLDGDKVHIAISDNGIGMTEETIDAVVRGERQREDTFSSVGLYQTIQRLRLKYGSDFTFHIDSSPGRYTRIDITYPAEKEEAS